MTITRQFWMSSPVKLNHEWFVDATGTLDGTQWTPETVDAVTELVVGQKEHGPVAEAVWKPHEQAILDAANDDWMAHGAEEMQTAREDDRRGER